MNKNKLFKTINELRNNIEKGLEEHPNICPYVKSWVIGDLDMIEEKAKGNRCHVWPYNATYKQLVYELIRHFNCVQINHTIEIETKCFLLTMKNITLLNTICDILKI